MSVNKIVVLVPVVLATWYLTASLNAQQPKKGLIHSQTPIATETVTKGINSQALAARNQPATYLYRYHLKGFDVIQNENQIQVTATVDMIDRMGDKTYIWGLKAINDGLADPLVDHLYADQGFSIHPSGSMSPTFAEVLTLPAGKNRINLKLYAVPNGFDLRHLTDDTILREMTTVGGMKEIVIQ